MKHFVLENDYVICELDDKIPVLMHRWKKPPSGKVFRDMLIALQKRYVELSPSYNNLAWLADTQLLGEIDVETEKWFTEVWDDLLFNQAKVKIHAVVLSEDFFAEYPMERFKMDAEEKFKKQGVQLGVFSEEEEALIWVRSR